MMIYDQHARIIRFVCQHAPHAENGFDQHAVAIGLEENGELIAGCVYSEYRGHSIHISMASTTPRWANRRTLAVFFGYPFLQLKCKRLTAYTGKSMANVRAFLTRLGFTQEGVIREGFADDDCVVYGMLSGECRWIPRTFHERQPDSAACA
mgnify:CR=1 FL=1